MIRATIMATLVTTVTVTITITILVMVMVMVMVMVRFRILDDKWYLRTDIDPWRLVKVCG